MLPFRYYKSGIHTAPQARSVFIMADALKFVEGTASGETRAVSQELGNSGESHEYEEKFGDVAIQLE